MALSDEERRLLEQMEAALAADDPRLAHTLRGNPGNRRVRRGRATLAVLGFLAGGVMLVGGMQSHWVVSVFGFVAMLVATIAGLAAVEKNHAPQTDRPGPRVSTTPTNTGTPFMDKMEERWRKRQEGD